MPAIQLNSNSKAIKVDGTLKATANDVSFKAKFVYYIAPGDRIGGLISGSENPINDPNGDLVNFGFPTNLDDGVHQVKYLESFESDGGYFGWNYAIKGLAARAKTGLLNIKISDSKTRYRGDFVFYSDEHTTVIVKGQFDIKVP